MSRLIFVKSHKVQQWDGRGPLYEEGKIYEFDGYVAETYAAKYKRLGYAINADDQRYNLVRYRAEEMEVVEVNSGAETRAEFAQQAVESGTITEGEVAALPDVPRKRGRPPKNA